MPFRKSSWLLLAGVVAVVGAVGGWGPRRLLPQFDQVVARQPTPFTELYFTNASLLPKQLLPGGPSGFGFTIVNHERGATTYHYVVSGVTAETSEPIGSGDVTLSFGSGTSVPVSFVPAVLGADYVVMVRLAGRPEIIHFASHS